MQNSNSSKLNHRKQLTKYQKINFTGSDDNNSFEINASSVEVLPSAGNHAKGSSKIRLQNMVDYTWEERFYTGQLLAVHMSGMFLAYGIKAASKSDGVVRVVKSDTLDRALIKGMNGMVQDIAFAHITTEIILACIDQIGNLFIYKAESQLEHPRLNCVLLLHIIPDSESLSKLTHRVIWCPYIPDVDCTGNDEDVARMLALTRGSKTEIWNIDMVTKIHGTGPVKPGEVEIGYLEILEHTQPIVDASFSPDGTAIATASLDGEVKFFQVHIKNIIKPRCLHHWQPHDGKPLSSLFFLDNHKVYHPEVQFWKYAITGANNNSELKLWSCETWTCLQTIYFSPRSTELVQLKPCLDLAAGYLLLSDMYRKVLYILELDLGSKETFAAILSVTEFLLPYPILSYGIVEAGIRRFKMNTSFTLDDLCTDDCDEDSQVAVVVRMFLVQPKSLQACQIVFQLGESIDNNDVLNIPLDPLVFRDGLSDMSSSVEQITAPLQELPANHNSLQLNLMTPDAFSSPVKHESPASSTGNINISVLPHSETTSPPHNINNNGGNTLMGFASGGSSPSREVQEILSLQEAKCFYQDSEIQQQQQESDELTPPEKLEPTVWPEIPILRANDVRKSEAENSRRSANAVQDVNDNGDNIHWKANQFEESSAANNLHFLLQTVLNLASEVKELRDEIRMSNNTRDLAKILSDFREEQNIYLQNALSSHQSRLNQETIISAISQSVINIVSTKLDDIISSEFSSNILPTIISQFEAMHSEIHLEMTQKLSTTDSLLKENIMKLVQSKSVMETLSSSLVTTLTPAIRDCLREFFSGFVIPGFEKACASMFVQINETFCKGTKEYVNTMETYSRKLSDKNRDQNTLLSDLIKSNSSQLHADLKKMISNVEVSLNEAVTKAMRVQQASLEGTVLAAVRSRAVTPALHVVDTQLQQHQIMQLISQGQINSAFQQALTASDLNLVVYVCEKVNPQQVFNQTPCPLQQHVLLSLIQQLSADMSNHTDIKHKYLEEAVMNLDVSNAMTKEHMPGVLRNLQTQLQAYITSNPNNKITRSMRMLQMATQSLLNS